MRSLEWIAFACFCAIVIVQAFVPPPIGLANNGDFGKVAGPFSLTAPTEDEFRFLTRIWRLDPASYFASGFATSEHLLAAAAIGINRLIRHDGLFDIRVMGALHASLYLLAALLLIPVVRGFGVVLIPIFAGTMYVEWMNTFYMDTAALVFLALAAAFYLRAIRWRRSSDRAGFLISAALFAAAKAQHAALALPIVALILLEPGWKKMARFRLLAAATVFLGAAIAWKCTPQDYSAAPVYDAIFLAILPGSPNIDADLNELGLSPSFRNFVGTYAFEAKSAMSQPELARQFQASTSHGKIARFALRHPVRALVIIAHALDAVGKQRPAMGNFERSIGKPPFTQSHAFSFWSDFKERIFSDRGWLLLFYGVVLSALLCVLAWSTSYRIGALCLIAMLLLATAITTLGDAVEPARHAFLFNVLLDFAFIAVLFAGLRIFAARLSGSKSPAS